MKKINLRQGFGLQIITFLILLSLFWTKNANFIGIIECDICNYKIKKEDTKKCISFFSNEYNSNLIIHPECYIIFKSIEKMTMIIIKLGLQEEKNKFKHLNLLENDVYIKTIKIAKELCKKKNYQSILEYSKNNSQQKLQDLFLHACKKALFGYLKQMHKKYQRQHLFNLFDQQNSLE